MQAKIILKEAYDIEYGLYNHDDPALNHPFQLHLWTEKKSIYRGGMFSTFLRKYHYHRILQYTGLNFLQFIELPIDKCERMFIELNAIMEEDAKRIKEQTEEDTEGMDKMMTSTPNNGMNSILQYNGVY